MTRGQYAIAVMILGSLSGIGPFSIDMYLPAFPAIAAGLKTSVAAVGYSMTSFFVGVSVGQLIYGPLLDRFGRKLPTLAGLALYSLAAVACALASSVGWLVAGRFFLALGGCGGMVSSRVFVRDLFPPRESARVFSTMVLVFGVSPVVAPLIGGLVVSWLGWSWIFGLMAALGALLFAAVAAGLKESHPPDPAVSLRPRGVLRAYAGVVRDPVFLRYTLAGGGSLGCLFAYLTGAPFVIMDLFGFSARGFGWIFGINALGLVAGSQVNRWLLKKHESAQIALALSSLQAALSLVLLATGLAGRWTPLPALILIFVHVSCFGFMGPNITALALRPFANGAGAASALMGGVQMVFGAASSALVSLLFDGTIVPMAGVMAACAALTTGLLLAARRA